MPVSRIGWPSAATQAPISIQLNESPPSRRQAPIAVITAPSRRAPRRLRSRRKPAGIASSTKPSTNTLASQPMAVSDTPYFSAATVVTGAKVSQTIWVAATASANAATTPQRLFVSMLRLPIEGVEGLAGGPATGADRPVHVVVPLLGDLRAGPVDATDRLGERLAVLGPHARTQAAAVAAAGELLLGPVLLEVVERLARPGDRSTSPGRPPRGGDVHRRDSRPAVRA